MVSQDGIFSKLLSELELLLVTGGRCPGRRDGLAGGEKAGAGR